MQVQVEEDPLLEVKFRSDSQVSHKTEDEIFAEVHNMDHFEKVISLLVCLDCHSV
jgi:hypothetical protein